MSSLKDKIYETYSSAKLHKDGNIVTSSDIAILVKAYIRKSKAFFTY